MRFSSCEWNKEFLGNIADVTKLAGFEFTEYVKYQEQGSIIAIRGLNCKNGKLDLRDVKYIDGSDFSKLKRSKLIIGDILFTYVGTVGETAIIEENEKYYLAPNVSRIRTNKINPYYLKHYLSSQNFFKKIIFPLIATSSQPALSMENIRKFLICYPTSNNTQEKIVSLLNLLDERIDTQNKIIDNLKSQIKSISSRVFKLFSKTNKLSELISFEKKTNHKSEEGLKEGRYPFYTNEENQNKYFDSYDFDGLFILSNTGGRANFKIVNGKFAVMSDTLVIKFKNPLLARTYINFLQNNTEKISHDLFAGSGLKHLDKNAFLNMNVPLVDKDLSIINKLFETLDNKLINEKKYLSLLIIQKQYLLNNLFI